MVKNPQWMTFCNPKLDWQRDNVVTVHGENDTVTGAHPRVHWMIGKSFFKAYKMAHEEGLKMLSYSAWNHDRQFKTTYQGVPHV